MYSRGCCRKPAEEGVTAKYTEDVPSPSIQQSSRRKGYSRCFVATYTAEVSPIKGTAECVAAKLTAKDVAAKGTAGAAAKCTTAGSAAKTTAKVFTATRTAMASAAKRT